VNKSLLDTDILSEIGKGIDRTVARHAAVYLSAFGRYTLSVAITDGAAQRVVAQTVDPACSRRPTVVAQEE